SEKAVRINAVGSGLELEDLNVVLRSKRLEGIVIPKVRSAKDVQFVSRMIDSIAPDNTRSNIRLLASIESAMGIMNIKEIVTSDLRLDGLIFAAEDYCADLGMIRTPSCKELLLARQAIVVAASAYGLQAIDMVCLDFRNNEILMKECREGREMGFVGKQAIHPNQIDIIQKTFLPDEKGIAARIIHEYGIYSKKGIGAFDLDGKVIDLPVVKWAERLITRAKSAGIKIPEIKSETKTKYGDEVAVKVQYPDVYRLFNVDIWTMQTMSNIVSYFFPEFELTWIITEFKQNLISEFDFEKEARNGELTKQRFRHHANEMSIPKIYWDLTTKRILTMEFIHGVKINDIDGLKKIGADPNWVRNILLEIFAEMIFCHGVIHCDPHPGNALVTISPKTKKPQIVLLDHGLYRELSDDFRKTYCDLWKALVLNDSNALKVVSESLGVPQYIQFLPLIFAQRISDSSTPLGEDMSLEEKNIVRDQLHNITLSDFFDFLEALPRDMLLVFRTINLVRGIHRQLGGSSIESFKMNAYYAIRGSWCETREEEFSRVDHANKLGIKGDESMIGPVHKWYLFGSTPNFARSLGFIKDLIVLTVRIYMAEIAIRIWRWCHRIHNLNDYIDDDDDTNKGTWATDGIIAPPKIASSAVQMYDYM
ncbi:13951_t:CDS:10, partial [Entrophospora sp. SA101]